MPSGKLIDDDGLFDFSDFLETDCYVCGRLLREGEPREVSDSGAAVCLACWRTVIDA